MREWKRVQIILNTLEQYNKTDPCLRFAQPNLLQVKYKCNENKSDMCLLLLLRPVKLPKTKDNLMYLRLQSSDKHLDMTIQPNQYHRN